MLGSSTSQSDPTWDQTLWPTPRNGLPSPHLPAWTPPGPQTPPALHLLHSTRGSHFPRTLSGQHVCLFSQGFAKQSDVSLCNAASWFNKAVRLTEARSLTLWPIALLCSPQTSVCLHPKDSTLQEPGSSWAQQHILGTLGGAFDRNHSVWTGVLCPVWGSML